MRTRNEIIERIEALKPSRVDLFGVMAGLLVFFLKYRDAGRFLKNGVTKEEWDRQRHPLTDERVRQLIHAGTRTSWVIANKRLAVESNKGFMVLECLCWILGDAEYRWAVDLFWTKGKMAHYGKPQLVKLHERFSFLGPWVELDDGRWHNSEFVYDLDAASALRQWDKKWGVTRLGGGESNNGRDS